MRRSVLPLLFSFCLTLPACGDEESSSDTEDVRTGRDTRGWDTGTDTDTGVETGTDAGADATTPDLGTPDTPTPDANPRDTGTPDTLPPRDTGRPDVPDGLECSEKAELVYVVDKDRQMHSFDPRSGTFELVGELDCGGFPGTATPGSMGLTRLGTAYVNYSDGEVHAVSIEDGDCTASGWTAQGGEFAHFGMSFVGTGGDETLYVASAERLARIDTDTWSLTPIGNLPSQCELAGNARGQLWGFFPLESPPVIHELDPTDASIVNSYVMPPLPPELDTFAFTAWGGDLYIFYRVHGMGSSTDVYRFTPGDSGPELVVEDTTLNIVGAGVSICAPTE